MYSNKRNRGITLIALVVTVVVLIILAGVSISMLTGNNGLLRQAINAKEQTEIASEKEQIALAIISSYENNVNNINKIKVQDNLNASIGENKTTLIEDVENNSIFYIKFINTNRYYEVDENKNINLIEVNGEKKLKITCVNSSNQILLEETYTVLKDSYTKELPIIENYSPPQEKIRGTITEDTNITLKYYWTIDESQLVFTGLNSSGDIVTNEDEIDYYMIGNNTSNMMNGLVSNPDYESALVIPNTHNNKNVISIGSYAFVNSNICIVIMSDNITSIGKNAFAYCRNISTLTLGKNLTSIGTNAFICCTSLQKVIFNCDITFDNPFGGCDLWKEIEVDENCTSIKVIDNVLYSADGKKLLMVPTGFSDSNFKVNDDVETISRCAFHSAKMEEITLGENVKNIETYAFWACYNITKVNLNSTLSSINKNAFFNCNSIDIIEIDSPSIANSLTSQTACGNLINNATTIYIKDSINSIGSYIIDNFVITTSDKVGYIKYIKNN